MAIDQSSSGDLIAVSRLKQANVDTAATIDALILFDEASAINIAEEREHNQGQKTGFVEPTLIEIKDRSAEGTLTQEKASPDGLAWMFAFFTGNHAVSTPETTVRRHISKVNIYGTSPPYFTAGHRKGGSSGAAAEFMRHKTLAITALDLTLAKGEFLKASASILGAGKYDSSVVTETLEVNYTTTSTATLANDPIGATDADKAANITAWCDYDDDGIFELPVTVVSYTASTNACVLTDLGTGTHTTRISYHVMASATGYEWGAFGSTAPLVTPTEFTMKAGNIQIKLGTIYSEPGTVPTIVGGQTAGCEIESLSYKGDWQAKPGKCWRTGTTEDPTATGVELGDMIQTISLERKVQDYLLAQNYDANTPMGLYFDALGPIISGTERFHLKVYFPRVGILKKQMKITDKKWAEAGDLVVLKDSVGGMATAIFQVQNEVASYLV